MENYYKIRHTLKEYMEIYKPLYIQLIFGQHIINIDTGVSGSYAIVRRFKTDSFKFKLMNDHNKLLILEY